MLFNSLEFVGFFALTLLVYFHVPQRARVMFLLVSSYLFYMAWKPEYIVLIVASTLVDYWASRRMGASQNPKARKGYLALSICSNLGLLFSFKYFNFFSESAASLLGALKIGFDAPVLDVLLPVGISFYTFQTLSYTIDVYNRQIEPEPRLDRFALFVSFWPQLVAGPIERSSRLLPQFQVHHKFDYERVRAGLLRMLWGMFKKVVIADRLAIYVNEVYNHPGANDGSAVVLASYFFAFQIYCDFSGYSDIAIGAARVMGFNLMENFNRPYFARGLADFWRRWHISLSTWFRDYVYIPLGGNRVAKWRRGYNLLLTFLVSGLWHGAEWTFVIWGGLHGLYLVGELWIQKLRSSGSTQETPGSQTGRVGALTHGLLTFHLVLFGWIFFRANNLNDATTLIGSIFSGSWSLENLPDPRGTVDLCLALVLIVGLMLHEYWTQDSSVEAKVTAWPSLGRWAYYVTVLYLTLAIGVFTESQFIYFQF